MLNPKSHGTHRIKVLFLPSWYPNEENSFSGIFIRRHAIAVSEFCDVCVIYLHLSENNTRPRIDFFRDENIKTIIVYLGKIDKRHAFLKVYSIIFKNNGLLLFLKTLKIFKREFGKPDIVHTHVVLPAGIFSLMHNLVTGIPYVITEHTGPFSSHINTRFKRLLCTLILARSRKIMPVSGFLEKSMSLFYKSNKYEVIPNVVDTQIFYPDLSLRKDQSKKKILHVSLLNDNVKNISGIIRATIQLSHERTDFEVLIVGDGPDREKLEKFARNVDKKQKFIFFLGLKFENELAILMRESHFFILNSYEETFSIVTAEALSSGIPVIATRCGGPEEYITDEMGILVPIHDSIALENSIKYMLDNWIQFNSNKIHQKIASEFSYHTVGKKYWEVYSSILINSNYPEII